MNTDRFKQQLLNAQSELETRLASIEKDVRHEEEPVTSDWSELAVERENDEVMDALGNETRYELIQVRAALRRIEEGDYFFCSTCGEEIGEARLEALPYTSQCVPCAEKQEMSERRI